MKNRLKKVVLLVASLLVSANLAFAVEVKVNTPDVAGAAKGAGDKTKASAVAAKDSAKAAKGAVVDTKAAAKGAVADKKAGAKAAVVDTKAAAKGAVVDTKAGVKAAVTDTKAGAKAAVVNTKASAVAAKDKATGAKDKATGAKAAAAAQTIDINTASEAELRAIPGVGAGYASKIIAGRPYSNKSQLKSRNILPAPVYDQVKEAIIAKRVKK